MLLKMMKRNINFSVLFIKCQKHQEVTVNQRLFLRWVSVKELVVKLKVSSNVPVVKSTNLQNIPLKEEVEVEEVEDKHEFLFTHVCEYLNLIVVLV